MKTIEDLTDKEIIIVYNALNIYIHNKEIILQYNICVILCCILEINLDVLKNSCTAITSLVVDELLTRGIDAETTDYLKINQDGR